MTAWIDFKALRAQLDFEQVLCHYGVEVNRRGLQHHGFCPLPGHQGKRNSASFSANLERGIFNCFGCGAKGNILEFAALMEAVDPHDGGALRKVAIKLQARFCPRTEETRLKQKPTGEAESKPVLTGPVVINAPLDFELKGLDQAHPYLLKRGFTVGTIALFGLGYCSRGLLKGRVAIPLHDQKGRLVGYAGRLVDDAAISKDNPKYRLPSKRERDGKLFEFRKTRFLYNGHRITPPVDNLIVVEGFTSVWWLVQNGFPRVVATMGADCSERQAALIQELVAPSGRVWILTDGDQAGERCAEGIFRQIAPARFVKWVKLEEGTQPTDLSADELRKRLTA